MRRVWSFFSNGWNGIGVLCERLEPWRRTFEKFYDRPIGVARILSILGVSATPKASAAVANGNRVA